MHGDIGALGTVIKVSGFAYLVGGLLFGIALYRPASCPAGPQHSSPSAASPPPPSAVMPDAFYRFLAFPNGIAMIALGYSLWQVARTDAATRSTAVDTPQAQHGRRRMSRRPRPPRLPARHRFAPVPGGGGAGQAGGCRPPCWRWP